MSTKIFAATAGLLAVMFAPGVECSLAPAAGLEAAAPTSAMLWQECCQCVGFDWQGQIHYACPCTFSEGGTGCNIRQPLPGNPVGSCFTVGSCD